MKKTKLNFGCGMHNKKGYYNVDILKKSHIDKSFDFNIFPYPLKDNSFDEIECRQVLEHCDYPKKVMAEFWRIGKPNAIIKIRVPYVNSHSAYSILDHTSYFNRWSFVYLNNDVGKGVGRETYELLENNILPQRFIKWIPMPILKFLAYGLNNVFVEIFAKVKIIKENDTLGE